MMVWVYTFEDGTTMPFLSLTRHSLYYPFLVDGNRKLGKGVLNRFFYAVWYKYCLKVKCRKNALFKPYKARI